MLVGWRSRDGLLADYPRRDDAAAHYRPFGYVGGRAVAIWGLKKGRVELEAPFVRVSRSAAEELRRDADDVEWFLSKTAAG